MVMSVKVGPVERVNRLGEATRRLHAKAAHRVYSIDDEGLHPAISLQNSTPSIDRLFAPGGRV